MQLLHPIAATIASLNSLSLQQLQSFQQNGVQLMHPSIIFPVAIYFSQPSEFAKNAKLLVCEIRKNLYHRQIAKTRTGLSRSSIYAMIKSENFPKYISLGARSVGWLESEVEAWIESRIKISRNK